MLAFLARMVSFGLSWSKQRSCGAHPRCLTARRRTKSAARAQLIPPSSVVSACTGAAAAWFGRKRNGVAGCDLFTSCHSCSKCGKILAVIGAATRIFASIWTCKMTCCINSCFWVDIQPSYFAARRCAQRITRAQLKTPSAVKCPRRTATAARLGWKCDGLAGWSLLASGYSCRQCRIIDTIVGTSRRIIAVIWPLIMTSCVYLWIEYPRHFTTRRCAKSNAGSQLKAMIAIKCPCTWASAAWFGRKCYGFAAWYCKACGDCLS
jgi:hypothetical protein